MKNERLKSGLTELLYETNGQLFDFTASIISCDLADNKEICETEMYVAILDRTAFFPEGGGQQADTGYLLYEDKRIPVTDVQTDSQGRVLHYIKESIPIGRSVEGHVDRDVRIRRMQNHSGEHLVSGLIYSMFSYENVGFHMLDKGARFDCSGPLTVSQLAELEQRANQAIYENVPITISYPDSIEALKIPYRSKLDIEEGVRLVTIDGYDICACCAPHLSSTGQIGVIKIIDAMPHRGGMRITMLAGFDAYMDYVMLHEDNSQIMALLSSKRETTAQFVDDFYNRNQKLKEENAGLKREMVNIISNDVVNRLKKRDKEDKSVEMIFTQALDNTGLRNLINSCTEVFDGIVIGFLGNDSDGYRYIMASSGDKDITVLNKYLIEKLGAKGGGNKQMIQGSLLAERENIERAIKEI